MRCENIVPVHFEKDEVDAKEEKWAWASPRSPAIMLNFQVTPRVVYAISLVINQCDSSQCASMAWSYELYELH